MTTPDRSTLLDLIARLEAATGPDRDTDLVIMQVLFPECAMYFPLCQGDEPVFWHGPFAKQECPKLTASIDAAVALIERVLPGAEWSAARNSNGEYFGWIVSDGMPHCDDHETPALVLCTALVKALIAVAKQ